MKQLQQMLNELQNKNEIDIRKYGEKGKLYTIIITRKTMQINLFLYINRYINRFCKNLNIHIVKIIYLLNYP